MRTNTDKQEDKSWLVVGGWRSFASAWRYQFSKGGIVFCGPSGPLETYSYSKTSSLFVGGEVDVHVEWRKLTT